MHSAPTVERNKGSNPTTFPRDQNYSVFVVLRLDPRNRFCYVNKKDLTRDQACATFF